MINSIKVGDVVFLKKSTVNKYGFNPAFIKHGARPFVVGKITDYGSYWVVPSYSNSNDFSDKTQKFYQQVFTPNGACKYLNFRDVIVVTKEDIIVKKLSSNIISLSEDEIVAFGKKFKRVTKLLKINREYFESKYYKPFLYEKNILCAYLSQAYIWLERDYNKVKPNRNFSKDDEFSKSDYGDDLYYFYINNLKQFLFHRNEYIPKRYKQCVSYFTETKPEILYKCLTDYGYVKDLKPLLYTDDYNEAKLLKITDVEIFGEACILDQVKVTMPLLDSNQELENASELIWLDNNIVTKKTYYDVFGCQPSKQELRCKLKQYKDLNQ